MSRAVEKGLIAAMGLLLLLSPSALAQEPSPVVAAVVTEASLAEDPRLVLLETQLDALPQTQWLDRADVNRLLDEQALSAAAGDAANVAGRLRLGRLTRAQVLLLIDRPAEDVTALRITVVQCATGLRLQRSIIATTDDPAEDVRALVDLADEALARHRQGVREVVAVVPFSSTDLSRSRDHLKASLAEVLARRLSARPGVLAVEIDEARAIAAELALSDGPAGVDRPAATFVDGTFASTDDDGVRVTLRYRRGGRSAVVSHDAADEPAAAAWLLTDASAVPEGWFGIPATGNTAGNVDTAAEAAALSDRAAAFARLGDWRQAYDLIEAAILLEDVSVRRAAAARYADELYDLLEDDLRGWEHLLRWSRAAAVPAADRHLINRYLIRLGRDDPDVARRARRDVVGIYRAKAARDERDAWVALIDRLQQDLFRAEMDAAHERTGDGWAWLRSSPQEMEFFSNVAAALAGMPSARQEDFQELMCGSWSHLVDSPSARKTLSEMATLDHPAARAAAAEMTRWLDSPWPKHRGRDPATIKVHGAPAHRRESRTSSVRWLDVDPGPWRGELCGWRILDPTAKLDAFWTKSPEGNRLYLLETEGPPKLIAEGLLPAWAAQPAVAFDGRWLWHLVRDEAGRTMLVALDPSTRQRRMIGHAQGLPADVPAQAVIAPIGEGRVALGVAFGPDNARRSYLAIAGLDLPDVRLILEAREYAEAFVPGLAVLAGGDHPANLVLFRGHRRPLLIDPSPDGAGVVGEIDLPHAQHVRAVFDFDGHTYIAAGRNSHEGGVYALAPGSLTAEDTGARPPRVINVLPLDGRLWGLDHGGPLKVADEPAAAFEIVPTRWPDGVIGGAFRQGACLFETSRYGMIWNSPITGRFWGIAVIGGGGH